jgi:hypothetical protein
MTTVTLHTDLQRSRFAHHALAAIARLIPGVLRPAATLLQRATRHSLVQAASLEAQKVRELARTYATTDPGFAADLYAAACRHEGKYTE